MDITITKDNVKRLASLSALGVGALAISVPAEAGIISFEENLTVGYTGPITNHTFELPGTASFLMETSGSGSSAHVHIFGSGMVMKITNGGLFGLLAYPAGTTWNADPEFFLSVPARRSPVTQFDGSNPYFLFSFTDSTAGGATRYGWGEMVVSFNGNDDPDVTLVRYAYEDTGAAIEAGDLGSLAPIPEPSAFALTGLGALLLGASGIRRWRAARQS